MLRKRLRLSISDAEIIGFIFSTKVIPLRGSITVDYLGEVQPL